MHFRPFATAEEVRWDSQQCYLGGWQKKIVLIFRIANHDGCAKYAQNKSRILIFCNSLRRESCRSGACTYGDESIPKNRPTNGEEMRCRRRGLASKDPAV